MRKKQPWMFVGAIVTVYNKKGRITKMQENTIDGIEYIYQVEVKLEGLKFSLPYHPSDLEELLIPESNR